MKTVFMTEDELLDYAPRGLAEIFAGGRKELKECRVQGYIPDLFNCDPDYIRLNGNRVAFVDLVYGKVRKKRYIISSDELTEDEQRYITALFDDKDELLLDAPNTWDWFNTNDGIAYRGGRGYSYSIWGIPSSPVALS